MTSPRLCWETGASVCPVFAPTTPPTPSAVVFLTHTHPAEGVDTALYVCWTQRPPPPYSAGRLLWPSCAGGCGQSLGSRQRAEVNGPVPFPSARVS